MMPSEQQPESVKQRVRRHRDALRKAGLRPVQIWVPDTRFEEFAEECKRQSAHLKNDQAETNTLDWIEHLSDDEGWS